ncbi:hypothetical protein ACOSP7_002818 [Xanthoceras sorbifolium]
MMEELKSLRVFETHFGIDRNQTRMSLLMFTKEFKTETRQMMLAMANGMGFLPAYMVLEEDSFLKKAVEKETTKIGA